MRSDSCWPSLTKVAPALSRMPRRRWARRTSVSRRVITSQAVPNRKRRAAASQTMRRKKTLGGLAENDSKSRRRGLVYRRKSMRRRLGRTSSGISPGLSRGAAAFQPARDGLADGGRARRGRASRGTEHRVAAPRRPEVPLRRPSVGGPCLSRPRAHDSGRRGPMIPRTSSWHDVPAATCRPACRRRRARAPLPPPRPASHARCSA